MTSFLEANPLKLLGLSGAGAALLALALDPATMVTAGLVSGLGVGAAAMSVRSLGRAYWRWQGNESAPSTPGNRGEVRLDRLAQQKRRVLRYLKDLEFDWAMRKISDTDFTEMKEPLERRAVDIMRQMDEAASVREKIERELNRRRAHRSAPPAGTGPAVPSDAAAAARIELVCVGCQGANDADARFCKHCGTRFNAEVRWLDRAPRGGEERS